MEAAERSRGAAPPAGAAAAHGVTARDRAGPGRLRAEETAGGAEGGRQGGKEGPPCPHTKGGDGGRSPAHKGTEPGSAAGGAARAARRELRSAARPPPRPPPRPPRRPVPGSPSARRRPGLAGTRSPPSAPPPTGPRPPTCRSRQTTRRSGREARREGESRRRHGPAPQPGGTRPRGGAAARGTPGNVVRATARPDGPEAASASSPGTAGPPHPHTSVAPRTRPGGGPGRLRPAETAATGDGRAAGSKAALHLFRRFP